MAAALVGGSVLSSVLNVLFDRLSSPEVVNWIRGKKVDQKLLGRLKTTLYAVQAFLIDAEQRQIRETAVKEWLDSLKDAVYVADDLLDEVATKAATQKDHPGGNFLSRFLNLEDREIANRMEDIIDTIESIVKQKDALNLKEIPKEDMSWRITTSLVETSHIYGRDKDKEAIIKLLFDDDTSDGQTSVIPIVGMGGIGKTTLAQLVYNDDQVKQIFNFRAWVCVSEEFDVVKVTTTIIEAITGTSCVTNDLNLLQHELQEKLLKRKFFIVLDDAWNENYDEWNMLLKPFQNKVKGSKILITTRSKKVASVVQTVSPHEISLLSHEDCWLVFSKHALLSTESPKNPDIETIGRQIVSKCDGLPLAAQTLGGLLRGNSDVRHWNRVLKSEIWEVPQDTSNKVISALRLSYYYLPSCLKECFVYCSLYPKDYEFDKEELILMWMAQDLLRIPNSRNALEEIGYEYFDELVARSFFQPSPHTYVTRYVMHDLMHDLATFYAGEFYFRAEQLESADVIGIKTRHLSHNGKGSYPFSKLLAVSDRVKHTRAFLEINLSRWRRLNTENSALNLLLQLKYLRVLSLEYFPLDHGTLPDSISDLIHLRYLDLSHTPLVTLPETLCTLYNLQTLKLWGCDKLKMLPSGMQDLVNLRHLDLSGTRIVTLPESLSNLYNLQTLKLRDCKELKMLPSGMQDLVNLRLLDISGTWKLEEMPKGMDNLKDLQFLSTYVVGKHEENKIRELGGLTNLHGSLRIAKLENVVNSGEASEARIHDKKHLRILELRWSFDADVDDSRFERDILDNVQPHQDLKELSIYRYRGTTFPDWIGRASYYTMTKLYLTECKNCCMLPSLGELPSLKQLEVSYFESLRIIDDGFYKNDESDLETPFPSLETLKFSYMWCWREWRSVELGAFPLLKQLEVRNCPVLKGDLPNHLPSLQRLTIEGCEQLDCSVASAPVILDLSIEGGQLVETALEAMTHTQPTCLIYLTIKDCESAISFPWACMPASLRKLRIEDCKELAFSMPQHHRLELLRSLIIKRSCDSVTSLQLDAFLNLTALKIRGCSNMKSVVLSESRNAAAAQLELLLIRDCPEIESVGEGGLPPNLKVLGIRRCEKLVGWVASMDLHNHALTSLHMDGPYCDSMKSFPHRLTGLRINGPWESVKWFPKQGCLPLPPSLQSLRLKGLESVETLDCKGLVHLTSLQYLTILRCPKLENIAGDKLPASLTTLCILSCPLLGKRCQGRDPLIWPKISHIPGIQVDWEIVSDPTS